MKKLFVLTCIVALLTPLVAQAHSGGEVMGTIKAFHDDTLTLTSTKGEEVSVELTAETRVLKGKQVGTRSDIHPGSRVVVHYAKDKTAAEVQLPAGS